MQLIKSLFEQAVTSGYRSTVLNPLHWLISILISGLIISFCYGLPSWMTITFFGCAITAIILYFVAYIYFMIKDRDALRSEKFTIQKLAIEKGIIGDSVHGILKNDNLISLLLPQAKSHQDKKEEDK
jgi:hypothetical protein